MPARSEIAYRLDRTGDPVDSGPSIGVEVDSTSQLIFFETQQATRDRTPLIRAGELLSNFIYAFDSGVTVPWLYSDTGLTVDAAAELRALRNTSYRFIIEGAIPTDPPSDFQMDVTNMVVSQPPAGNFTFITLASNSVITNNLPDSAVIEAEFAQQILPGRRCLVQNVSGGSVLPKVPGIVRVPFWASVNADTSDFAALAITGDDVLDSVATRGATLTIEYDPRYADLDTRIEYGFDTRGNPLQWRIASTSRIGRYHLELQLSTVAF